MDPVGACLQIGRYAFPEDGKLDTLSLLRKELHRVEQIAVSGGQE